MTEKTKATMTETERLPTLELLAAARFGVQAAEFLREHGKALENAASVGSFKASDEVYQATARGLDALRAVLASLPTPVEAQPSGPPEPLRIDYKAPACFDCPGCARLVLAFEVQRVPLKSQWRCRCGWGGHVRARWVAGFSIGPLEPAEAEGDSLDDGPDTHNEGDR